MRIRLDYCAMLNAHQIIADMDLIAIVIAPADLLIMDYFVEWINTEEESDIHGSLETVLTIVECTKDATRNLG